MIQSEGPRLADTMFGGNVTGLILELYLWRTAWFCLDYLQMGDLVGGQCLKDSMVEVVTSFIPPAILLVLCHRWGNSSFNKKPSINSLGSLSLQEGP